MGMTLDHHTTHTKVQLNNTQHYLLQPCLCAVKPLKIAHQQLKKDTLPQEQCGWQHCLLLYASDTMTTIRVIRVYCNMRL